MYGLRKLFSNQSKRSQVVNLSPDSVLDEFWQVVYDTYGTYCDASQAFYGWHKSLEANEKEILDRTESAIQTNPTLRDMPVIVESFSYGRYVSSSMKDKQKDMVLPQFSYEEVKNRNSLGGQNHRYIGNMCVVTIYHYWEDHYRGKLAKEMNLEHKNCIFSELFGDIAALRRGIIHNGGKADNKIPRRVGKTWFQKEDEIIIDQHKFENLID